MTEASMSKDGSAAFQLPHDDPILREVYLPLAEIPVISAASFVGTKAVSVTLSTRDFAANVWLKTRFELGLEWTPASSSKEMSKPVVAWNSGSSVPAVPVNADTIKASWQSPDSALKVILRESTVASTSLKDGGAKRRTVEVWNGHRALHRVDVTKAHGSFATDDTFGTLDVYRPNGDQKGSILYTAESNVEAWEDPEDDLAQYDYRPSFGEKLQARVRTTLFLLKLDDLSVSELKLHSGEDGPMPAKSVFSADGKSIYTTILTFIGDGRRLGQVYCTNRPSAIHEISLPANGDKKWEVKLNEETRRSEPGISAISPYPVPNSVVYLGFKEGGAHGGCCAVFRAKKGSVKELVPFQYQPSEDGWRGLYAQSFPTFALLKLGSSAFLIISGIRQARNTPIVIDINEPVGRVNVANLIRPTSTSSHCPARRQTGEDHAAHLLSLEEEHGSWSYTVLNTDLGRNVLARRSRPNVPHQLVLGSLAESYSETGRQEYRMQWSVLWRADADFPQDKLFARLRAVQAGIVNIDKAAKGVQSVVVRPPADDSSKEAPPFILFPHGGPHSASTIDWSPMVAALAVLGYTVALPNYSGSLGISQDFVDSLLGNCGTLDVDDCFATVEHFIEQKVAQRDRLFTTGGSHGGFLTAHMIARPYFRAAVMRNPVIAAGQQAVSSDIPDWCFAEFGEAFDFKKPPVLRPDVFKKLEEQSPIAHMDKIEAPVLLLVGLVDKRVPYWNQGKVLYHALKARQNKVRMLSFKDCDHALDTLEAEAISFLSTVRWFREASDGGSKAELYLS
ncbi:hypothetical protein A4X13_0g3909 [Tilletia indica]|uniref:Dipeptidyl-peptidase V n=1 Tax=Tilletia indica TaxID=43049 RepID=A0A177TC67_9BASI|nr:hypothetical protein A4X13_0g3909 [Tilletia indica]